MNPFLYCEKISCFVKKILWGMEDYGKNGLSMLPIQDISGDNLNTENDYMYYYSVEFTKWEYGWSSYKIFTDKHED